MIRWWPCRARSKTRSSGCVFFLFASIIISYKIKITSTIFINTGIRKERIYGEKELSSTSENSTNQDKVKWAVKNGNTTYVDFGIEETKGNSEEEKVDIYQHRPQATTPTSESGVVIGNTFGKAGSIQLSINTESLWEKKADIYSANLIVVISTESSTPGGN